MEKKSSGRVDYWDAIWELVKRDPLYQRLINQALENRRKSAESIRADEETDQLQEELRQKWGCSFKISQRPDENTLRVNYIIPWAQKGAAGALSYESNFTTYGPGTEGWFRHPRIAKSSPTPIITFQLDLSKVTQWDLDQLSREFRRVVRGFIRSRPAWHGTLPPELAFLRTVRTKQFSKDLHRYDLHMGHGLSFRLIALLEAQQKTGKELPKVLLTLPPKIGPVVK